MLLGTLPMGTDVHLDAGGWAHLSPQSLEGWATHPRLLVPVLIDHDPDRAIGWVDKVKFTQSRAMFYGQLLDELPDARTIGRLVGSHTMNGLSPGVKTHTDGEIFYRATGRWGPGTEVELPELSVVWVPAITDARWLRV